ncbi:MAG: HAMP domain-containing sensor histidine kinase [Acidobacteriaceae bacterium]
MALMFPRGSDTAVETPPSAAIPRRPGNGDANRLAHDTRNWLTILQVYCDLLRTSGAVASGYETWIDELSGAVERGHGLVDSLLHSVEATEDAIPIRVDRTTGKKQETPNGLSAIVRSKADSSMDLAATLRRRLPLLRRMAGSKIRVEIHAPVHAARVRLAESTFDRILYNLVGNAIEAMPIGGKLTIELCVGHSSKAYPHSLPGNGGKHRRILLLRVADTGTGIDPARLPYIFDAGVSGKKERAGHPERHGFGLAIVRDLTECAGGAVRVYSHRGRGSRFEVELPMM